MSILHRFVDERFLTHRLRSTSIAGMAGVLTAWGIFMYRYLAQSHFSADLFAVIAVMALVKLAAMAWFYSRH
jgi:hypothetical protein